MCSILLALVFGLQPAPIQRDAYGVPWITATNESEAYFLFGKAVAEDRLWQMEMSRRVSRGRLAEVLGKSALASDQQVAKTGYTDEEILAQFNALQPKLKSAFEEYSRGVNDTINSRREHGTLPDGYAKNGFEPEPWTPLDSAAIVIQLMKQFGRGGSGELRNYALLLYLKGQQVKDKVFDVMDDLAWQNDPTSVPTLSRNDDLGASSRSAFSTTSRKLSEAHVASLPPTNIFELMPAIQLSIGEETDLIAESVGTPYKVGSYAVVVSPALSRSGKALLLSGPQMGHTDPSVVHEVAIKSPELTVAGIDVPGIPTVVIGATPFFAWGLTSGVADIEDVYYFTRSGESEYLYGREKRPLINFTRTIKVKGSDPVVVDVMRTHYGPVILDSKVGGCVYSVRSSFWNRELSGVAALMDTYRAKSARELHSAIGRVPVTFNYFYATVGGETGYRYAGLVPVRAKGYDPRFPLPGGPETDWQGFVSASSMPHTMGTKSGLIANWNNKPSADWPNMDTPAWGAHFRNELLLASLPSGKIEPQDLEKALQRIAQDGPPTTQAFLVEINKVLVSANANGKYSDFTKHLANYDGRALEGSVGALMFDVLMRSLRREIFKPSVGTFIQPTIFETVIQPSVVLKALKGETHYDFLAGRSSADAIMSAMDAALIELKDKHGDNSDLWSFTPGRIFVRGQSPILYNNRGTYIQIFELGSTPIGRSVASPGVSEIGPHSADQADLALGWKFKPMRPLGPSALN